MAPTFVTHEPCTPLPWDSAFWGYPIARLEATTLTPERLEEALAWCRGRAIRCLYAAACGTCPQTLALAAGAGFRFVDVRLELERAIDSSVVGDAAAPAAVRPATAADREPLRRLARLAHRDTRFFKDPSFDPARAAELYAAWIARDLESGAVLVWDEPDAAGGIGGYVSCQPGADSAVGRIGLAAVDPGLRGRGVGRCLLAAAVRHCGRDGARTVAVATQATNVAALRLYEQGGFRAAAARVWFHKWFA